MVDGRTEEPTRRAVRDVDVDINTAEHHEACHEAGGFRPGGPDGPAHPYWAHPVRGRWWWPELVWSVVLDRLAQEMTPQFRAAAAGRGMDVSSAKFRWKWLAESDPIPRWFFVRQMEQARPWAGRRPFRVMLLVLITDTHESQPKPP